MQLARPYAACRVGLAATAALLLGVISAGVMAQPFTDRAAQLGLQGPAGPEVVSNLVAAVSVADVNGDGLLDIFQSGSFSYPQLWLRTAAGYESGAVLLPDPTPGLSDSGHTLFDMDGDGDRDLLLLRNGVNRLWEWTDAGFVDVTEPRLPGLEQWAGSAAAVDVDGDGDLDLYVSNYIDAINFPDHVCAMNRLLANDGHGFFTDITAASGLGDVAGCSFISAFYDHDGDGDPDLLVVNDFGQFDVPGSLMLNVGPALGDAAGVVQFVPGAGFNAPVYGMGIGLADVDADGRLDATISTIGAPWVAELSDAGVFEDRAAARGAWRRWAWHGYRTTWAVEYADFDGDGWQDLMMSAGFLAASAFIRGDQKQRNLLLLGRSDGVAIEALPSQAPAAGDDPWGTFQGRDMAVADLTGDGRLDILQVSASGQLAFLENLGAGPPLVALTLEATETAATAIGAKIVATCAGLERHYWIKGGRFYGSADASAVALSFPAPCGLSAGLSDDLSVHIRWPSGLEQRVSWESVSPGTALHVSEPDWLSWSESELRLSLDPAAGVLWPSVDSVFDVGVGGGGALGDLVGAGPSALGASWAGEEGQGAWLSLTADGRGLGVHPRRAAAAPDAPRLMTYPAIPIRGTSVGASLRWPGAGEDAAPIVIAAGVAFPMTRDATGQWWADVDVPEAAEMLALRVMAGGMEQGGGGSGQDGGQAGGPIASADVPTGPLADPQGSSVRWRRLHQLGAGAPIDSRVWVRVRLRDANGKGSAQGLVDSVGLWVNGQPVDVGEVAASSKYASFSVLHSTLDHGDVLTVTLDGQPLGAPQVVAHGETASQIGALVDLARSHCVLSDQGLEADGDDRGWAVVGLQDAGGVPIDPELLEFTASGVGVTPILSTLGEGPGGLLLAVQAADSGAGVAGVEPGVLSIEVQGAPGPIVCEIPQIRPSPRRPVASALSAISWADGTTLSAAGDLPDVLRIIPRDQWGMAVGSDVKMAVTVEGQSDQPLAGLHFWGAGEYRLPVSLGPGEHAVTVTGATGWVLTQRVTVPGAVGGGDVADSDVSDGDGDDADTSDDDMSDDDASDDDTSAAEVADGGAPTDTGDDGALDGQGPPADITADSVADGSEPLDIEAAADSGERPDLIEHDGGLDIGPTPADSGASPETSSSRDTGAARPAGPDGPDGPDESVESDGCAGSRPAETTYLVLFFGALLFTRRRSTRRPRHCCGAAD